MIILTAPNGHRLSIKPDSISFIELNDGTYSDAAKSVIIVNGFKQAVKETPSEIENLINGH